MDYKNVKTDFFKRKVDEIIHSPEYFHASKADISRTLEVKPQYLNAILNGSRNVSDKFFQKFIEAFDINQNELSFVNVLNQSESHSCSESKTTFNKDSCKACDVKDKLISTLEAQLEKNEALVARLEETILKREKDIEWLREQIQINCNPEESSKQKSAS